MAGFILLPGAFLYVFFQGAHVCCHQLSDKKFFEPITESVSGHLLALLSGIWFVHILQACRFHLLQPH